MLLVKHGKPAVLLKVTSDNIVSYSCISQQFVYQVELLIIHA